MNNPFRRINKSELEAQTIQRNRITNFKQAFGTEAGRETLMELMNRFHVINPHDGSARQEGERAVVLYIMEHVGMNLAEFDKLWRGEEGEQSA